MFQSLSLGGLSWKELGRRVWSEMQEDEVLGRAAQLSYYFLLALFPLLLFLTSLLGWFAGEDSELRRTLFEYLSTILPGEAATLVDDTVADVTQGSGGGKLSFGILATLWAASNGMGAISESLNVAYDVKETRPWWKTRLFAIFLTFALALLVVSALVLVLYGHDIAETVAGRFGLGAAFELAWKVLQWPIALVFVLLGFALIYYLAPDIRDQDWKWVTPGSILAMIIWLAVSFGFRTYLLYFNSYSATYGSLGAVIILMLWFYFTGAAILVGGEINSEIEHEMALRGAPDAKEKGEKAPDAGKTSARTAQTGAGDPRATASDAQAGAGDRKAGVGDARAGAVASGGGAGVASRGARPVAGRVTREGVSVRDFSLRKAAVVLGALALSKIWPGRKGRRG
ncbi:MAG TPA: YihY/virulence factor BrkB family protein [Pyrinomonadaceae bacterium]|nr:YihY/virulence factor BrkB family protein [Pyrinomonadaceae bacterium]